MLPSRDDAHIVRHRGSWHIGGVVYGMYPLTPVQSILEGKKKERKLYKRKKGRAFRYSLWRVKGNNIKGLVSSVCVIA